MIGFPSLTLPIVHHDFCLAYNSDKGVYYLSSDINHDYSLEKNSTPFDIVQNSHSYEKKQIFSSEDQIMDYVKSKGIQTRTGVEEKDFGIFVLKELMDNAVDFIEAYVPTFLQKEEKPIIKVIIDQTNSITKIRVINSNAEIDVFSEYLVRQIFNFNKFYSSKRNRYHSTRGALEDALKEVLCVPYALADKKEIED